MLVRRFLQCAGESTNDDGTNCGAEQDRQWSSLRSAHEFREKTRLHVRGNACDEHCRERAVVCGNDRLAKLVRNDQDLAAEAEALDKLIIATVSKAPADRDSAREQRIRDRLAAIDRERGALQKVFAAEFPDYAALSNPEPLAAVKIQGLLSADESLVVFSAGDQESYVFDVTRDGIEWKKIASGSARGWPRRSLPFAMDLTSLPPNGKWSFWTNLRSPCFESDLWSRRCKAASVAASSIQAGSPSPDFRLRVAWPTAAANSLGERQSDRGHFY
jgi:hypothetical protein